MLEMSDSAAKAPSSNSGNKTTKEALPAPLRQVIANVTGSNDNASTADAPKSSTNSSTTQTSPTQPPENKSPPPSPASPPPQNKSPPLSPPPPPPSNASPPPTSSQEQKPPPPPSKQESSPSPPPPEKDKKSPPPSEKDSPPSPSPPPPKENNSPPSPSPPPSSPPPSTSPGTPSPPPSPPPPAGTTPPASPPPPITKGAMSPNESQSSPQGPTLPSNSSSQHPRHHSAPPPGAVKGQAATAGGGGGDGNTKTVTVAIAIAGAFFLAMLAIFFVIARRKKRRDNGFPGNYIPPKNFSAKSDAYVYGQPQSAVFTAQNGAFNCYTYHNPQLASNGSQKGYNGSGGVPDSDVIGGAKSFFTYEEIMEITNGFSPQNVIGEGGFGFVYKGHLLDGKPVAVKNLKSGGGQGDREFKAEVEIISRVHHRHLVSLVGYCIADNHRVLIYEFVPNKTLEHHLHNKGLPVLDWRKRMKIALGAAKGLAYLHEDCHPKIIHRDIKSANILLEDDFEAQVADFGLARPNTDAHTHVSTRVMGTFGYLAPEYASSGKLTDRSDVYSFGVVLLELITGRKPVDPSQPLGDESLVEWARPLLLHALETGDFSELVDPRLEKHYVESEMFRMIEAAAACIRHSAPKRPRMIQVVRALDCEGEMSDLTNGVMYGQSTIYDSAQYDQDIQRFRRMAFGSGDCSDLNYTEEYTSKDWGSGNSSGQSSVSETRALNNHTPGYS